MDDTNISEQVAQGIVKGAGRLVVIVIASIAVLCGAVLLAAMAYSASDAAMSHESPREGPYFRWSDGTLHTTKQPANTYWTDAGGVRHEVDAVTGKLTGPAKPFEAQPSAHPPGWKR